MAKRGENRKTTRDDGTTYDRGPGWPSITALTLAMAVTAVFFNNCSNEFLLRNASDEASLAGLSVCEAEQAKVFYSSIHPFTSNKCASCHVPTGPAGASSAGFADKDKRAAFNAFLLPGFEKFKAYSLNPGHVNGITGPENLAAMDRVEVAWVAAGNSVGCKDAGDSGEFRTKLVDKPIGATTGTAKVIQFNLDNDSDRQGEFGGATFEISIAQNTPVGGAVTYYITRPNVKTAAQGMEVKAISVYINGQKYIEGTTFLGIDRYVPAATTNLILSNATVLKQMPAGVSPNDTIAVSFNHLRLADPPPVTEPTPTPTPPATPLNGALLYANACAGCHGSLAASTKRGRTAQQILTARMTVPSMMDNAAVQALSAAEIGAIADALR